MDMHSLRSKISQLVCSALVISSVSARAQPASDGVLIDVNGAKRGLYPLATPLAPEGDAVSKEVATVESVS